MTISRNVELLKRIMKHISVQDWMDYLKSLDTQGIIQHRRICEWAIDQKLKEVK